MPCRGGTTVAPGLSRSAPRRNPHYRDGAGKHLRWRADDLVASELGYRSRTLGWYWAIRLHGAPVSSFRVRLSRTGRGGMSVLGRDAAGGCGGSSRGVTAMKSKLSVALAAGACVLAVSPAIALSFTIDPGITSSVPG